MHYTLGLDIGISSVGWAVLQNMSDGEPFKIEDLGVRIFEKAEQPKTGASLALSRREARGARRRLRRRRHRKERVKALLQETGCIDREELEALLEASGFDKDVYTLRAEGLDRRLTQAEWARVLLHLAQRRGYRSNSTAEAAKDQETGALKTALSANQVLMEAKGYRTAGEMFCLDKKFQMLGPDGQIWRKTRNTAGDYSFTVTRDMVEAEAHVLFASQRQYGSSYASENMESRYCEILLSQRDFDVGPGGDSPFRKGDLRGNCTFERTELRAFKACYTFEYFKLLQDLNHIRIQAAGHPSRSLSADERERLTALAMKSAGLHYGQLRKELALREEERFNTVRYQSDDVESAEKKTKFQEMQSYHKIRKALDGVGKRYIASFSHNQLDEIATVLSLYKSDERRREQLSGLGLEDVVIQALLPLSFSKAGNLSLSAMKKMIPHLKKGVNYDEAASAVYGDHRGHFEKARTATLSYGELQRQGALDAITNPVVLRAVSQTCKVINAVVRRYGSPQAVHIELAREMSRNFADRQKMDKQYQENRAANERLIQQVEEIKGSRATGQDLVKFKLFRDQNEVCLYSGTKLQAERLFEPGYVDVDHIIPYSICFDDGYRNKALVLASENRQKGNRLPLEYMAGDEEKTGRFVTLVEISVRDYRKRQRLLKRELIDEDLEGFKERNLSDTQYITRAMYNLLNDYLQFAEDSPFAKKPVRAVNGAVTDYMRKRLGLHKNRADGDLHHAMDAAVVAITTDRMIQRISNYAKRREWGTKVRGNYVDPETGELLTQEVFDEKYAPSFPPPWPQFRQELEARLAPDPNAEIRSLNLPHYDPEQIIRPVFVSRMPNRKVSGAAHKETIRSGKLPGYSIVKTALTDLKLDKNGEIKDYYNPSSDRLLYEALRERLKQFDGDGKKAFAQPFHKPKKDGMLGPVVNKVKTYGKSSLNVAACGGIADNGGMVRIDVFHVEDDGYYFVPIYTADTVKGQLPQKAVVAYAAAEDWKPMSDSDFLFSLYAGDLIRIARKKPIGLKITNKDSSGQPELLRTEWMLYYSGADISTGAIIGTTHERKYTGRGIGIKTLQIIEKYEVDPLGEYHRVHTPEKRQTFR